MAARNIVTYTSIPPELSRSFEGTEVGDRYQKACISSWRALSDNIVSLNSMSEIEGLRTKNYGIQFHETEMAPPKIGDFIAAAMNSGHEIAAIVNADCLLTSTPAVLDAAVRAAAKGMVLFERLNISPEFGSPTGQNCWGFDLFVFNVARLAGISIDDNLRIGSPWWDYWFPISYHRAGGELFSRNGPALVHLDHAQGWNEKSWVAFGTSLLNFLTQPEERFLPQTNEVTSQPTIKELSELAKQCFLALQARTRKLVIEDDISNFLLLISREIENIGNTRIYLRASKAESQPLRNLYRYFKWQSSKVFAALGEQFSRKFAHKMQRRSIKNAPLSDKPKTI